MKGPGKTKRVNVYELLGLTTVECCGQTHRIGLNRKKQLIPFDHQALGHEETVREAAGLEASCACGALLRKWREKDAWALPRPLDTWKRATWREGQRRSHTDPLLVSPPWKRFEARITQLVKKTFRECSYRLFETNQQIVLGGVVEERHSARVIIHTDSYVQNETRRVDATVKVYVPLRWYIHVYRAGLATVQTPKGLAMVLDTIGHVRPDGSRLLRVALQTRGYQIKVVMMRLTKRGALVNP